MTWEELLKEGLAERHKTSRKELDALRAVVRRNLADARVVGVSADTRFACAYEAALTLATMAIAHAGFRVRGPGHHRTTLEALRLAMEDSETAKDARYFDSCRRLRNELSYEATEVVNDREVEELLERVAVFERRAESILGS